jgi:hypothetical protein
MWRPLLREVVQKLLAEENDRCEGDRRTENKSSDDVQQFHLNPLTRALSSKDNWKIAFGLRNLLRESLQALNAKLAVVRRAVLTDLLGIRDSLGERTAATARGDFAI